MQDDFNCLIFFSLLIVFIINFWSPRVSYQVAASSSLCSDDYWIVTKDFWEELCCWGLPSLWDVAEMQFVRKQQQKFHTNSVQTFGCVRISYSSKSLNWIHCVLCVYSCRPTFFCWPVLLNLLSPSFVWISYLSGTKKPTKTETELISTALSLFFFLNSSWFSS